MTKKPTDKPNKVTNPRDSKKGTFVTEEYAKKHPDTTTVEHNPKPKPTKQKGK